jgi:AcrR family transcriptional regulator
MAQKRARAKAEFLDAAETALNEEGLSALTLDEVARRVGVTKPALYHYFPNKEALVAGLIERLATDMVETLMSQVEAAASGREALEITVRAFVAFFRERHQAFRALFLWPQVIAVEPALVHEKINPMMRTLFGAIEEKLESDRRDGQIKEGVHPRRVSVLGFLSGFSIVSLLSLFQASETQSLHEVDDLVDEMCCVLLHGVQA